MMRKIAGICFLCLSIGMFIMLLVKDRLAGMILVFVLAAAAFFCLSDG